MPRSTPSVRLGSRTGWARVWWRCRPSCVARRRRRRPSGAARRPPMWWSAMWNSSSRTVCRTTGRSRRPALWHVGRVRLRPRSTPAPATGEPPSQRQRPVRCRGEPVRPAAPVDRVRVAARFHRRSPRRPRPPAAPIRDHRRRELVVGRCLGKGWDLGSARQHPAIAVGGAGVSWRAGSLESPASDAADQDNSRWRSSPWLAVLRGYQPRSR